MGSDRITPSIIIIALVSLIVVSLLFILYSEGEKASLQKCKDTYGQSYVLGHSAANSSIKWCQAPDGTVKAL